MGLRRTTERVSQRAGRMQMKGRASRRAGLGGVYANEGIGAEGRSYANEEWVGFIEMRGWGSQRAEVYANEGLGGWGLWK